MCNEIHDNFWCILFVVRKSLKHVQKTAESWENVGSIPVFHQKHKKTLLHASKSIKIYISFSSSFSDNHGQNSWDTFAFPGSSFIIHTCPTPPLTPQTTLDMCFSNLLTILNFQWVFGNKVKNCSFLHP